MKFFKCIFSATLLFALFTVFSCSELDTSEASAKNTEIPAGYGAVKLNLGTQAARTITPFDINLVSSWNVYFKGAGGSYDTLYFSYTLNELAEEFLVRAGTWAVLVSGGYTDSSNSKYIYFSGSTTVTIEEDSSTTLDIILETSYSTEDEETTGSLSFSTKLDDSTKEIITASNQNYVSATATLTNLATQKETTFECKSTDTDSDAKFSFNTTNNLISLSADGLEPGYYTLAITFTCGTLPTVYNLILGDTCFQIAKGLTTSNGTTSESVLGYASQQIFYGTNGESTGNGLVSKYPKNLNEILKDFSGTQNFAVYMTDAPQIDMCNLAEDANGFIYYSLGTTTEKALTITFTKSTSNGNVAALSLASGISIINETELLRFKNNSGWTVGKSSSVTGNWSVETSPDGEWTIYKYKQ